MNRFDFRLGIILFKKTDKDKYFLRRATYGAILWENGEVRDEFAMDFSRRFSNINGSRNAKIAAAAVLAY